MVTSLFWFRRDLRISDHPALAFAARRGPVVPVFVIEPQRFGSAGPARRPFLLDCLQELNHALSGRLTVLVGDPAEELIRLAQLVGSTQVVATGEVSPSGQIRDGRVGTTLRELGIDLQCIDTPYLTAPGQILNGSGQPFKVFTPYWKAAAKLGVVAPLGEVVGEWVDTGQPLDLDQLRALPDLSSSLVSAIDAPVPTSLPRGGEKAAWGRLQDFLGRVDTYGENRNLPGVDGSSRLSPDLHFGTLHPRQILAEVAMGTEGREAFVRQVYWREFYGDVAANRPDAVWSDLNPNRVLVDEGTDTQERFSAWALGQTGYPLVDAGMRQLLSEGWMHNRVRMLAASFLVKDLHLPWQWGAKWFLHRLVDGDVANNNHGWQWTAGVGTDASPYYRVFNPTLQAERFDPEGIYIRRHVSELKDVEAPAVLQPGGGVSGSLLSNDYPAPMLDHAVEREESLRRLDLAR